ncbi:SPFH domain-containing protein [Verrucomicrobium sp. BvORR106]|uniref:SPFH domain-containing protein n=1 Tax=Verrucomicrobium sp. BvORR106 TaxID=1403819 RepID=UPI000571D3E7|nr:SPFH domain-containing protein [Verrucomicrobium sp. BvORR106]
MITNILEFIWTSWWLKIPLSIIALWYFLGVVYIGEQKVGIVIKRFAMRNLPPGQIIALKGEAGYQADVLPPGLHFFYWTWQYRILHMPLTYVPSGEIALVVAAAGAPIPPGRILGRTVSCNHFENARAFLAAGGEKGRQLAILTAGTYRINSALFTVITSWNATDHGLSPEMLRLYKVEPDRVGIVTTLDGAPIAEGEIAGTSIPGHDNFQNAQSFLDSEGHRGLQEQVLLSGVWNLNPWFAQVEQVPMVEIPIGHVGVVISYVGQAHEDVSGVDFKHGDLVLPGHKGVWISPLYPGKHPLNTRIMRVELVPTTNIVLNWATRTESHQFDAKLSSITVRSRDGFAFNLDVSQIIHIGALEAPKVISRAGSLQNLIDHVLQPIVGNYFRNSAQDYTVLDFLSARSHRQSEAAEHIATALREYDVEAIDTLIGDITPPEQLMKTQTDRKIAEEQRKTYEMQEAAETQRQQLVRQTSLADIQHQVVGAEQGVQIAELQARASVRKSEGEAESIRLRANGEADAIRATGNAKAEAYTAGVESLGHQNYAMLQLMQIIGERNVRVVPDVAVTGAQGGSGLLDALMAMMVKRDTLPQRPASELN